VARKTFWWAVPALLVEFTLAEAQRAQSFLLLLYNIVGFSPLFAGLASWREFAVQDRGFRFAASGLRFFLKQWHECPVFVNYPS
jgi:hypothetical protein